MFVRELGSRVTRSRLLGALDQLFHAPALLAGKGSGLDDEHAVADLVLVLLVVGFVLLAAGHELAVLGVREPALDHDDAGLLHLVAGHHPDQLAPARDTAAGLLALIRLGFRILVCVGHGHFSFALLDDIALDFCETAAAGAGGAAARSFSASTVLTRAMSRRA